MRLGPEDVENWFISGNGMDGGFDATAESLLRFGFKNGGRSGQVSIGTVIRAAILHKNEVQRKTLFNSEQNDLQKPKSKLQQRKFTAQVRSFRR